MTTWLEYPIGVPFGNSNYDVALGGSHDQTYLCPPNTEVFQIAEGVITDISSPSWGKQVTIKLTSPVEGHGYFAILHLAAINPDLRIGETMKPNDIVGWSGGCVVSSQYNGTYNPTGENFCNSPEMSSRPQVGIALCDGPAYGGIGWKQFPPIDTTLDPNPLIEAYLKEHAPAQEPVDYRLKWFSAMWDKLVPGWGNNTAIFKAAYNDYVNGKHHGIILTGEFHAPDENNEDAIWQILAQGIYKYQNGKVTWSPFKG